MTSRHFKLTYKLGLYLIVVLWFVHLCGFAKSWVWENPVPLIFSTINQLPDNSILNFSQLSQLLPFYRLLLLSSFFHLLFALLLELCLIYLPLLKSWLSYIKTQYLQIQIYAFFCCFENIIMGLEDTIEPTELYEIEECVGRGNFGDVYKA